MIRSLVANGLNKMLLRFDAQIMHRSALYDWQRNPVEKGAYNSVELPVDARAYLRPDNPRLVELQRRYAAFSSDVTTPSFWQEGHLTTEDIAWFRGDNPYVWQRRGPNMNAMGYAMAFYYAKSIDTLGLLETLHEDQAFGIFTHHVSNKVISRI
jgi:hypothetical protein